MTVIPFMSVVKNDTIWGPFSHLGLTQKQLQILAADASHLAALRKLGICPIFLRFLALPAGRLNATHL
jgi:hypothetical protein